MRVRVLADNRGWILSGNLFNLHAASGGCHQQNAAAAAVDQCGEVDLAQDLCRWCYEHAAHGEILNREGEDLRGDRLRLFGGGGELDAPRLSAPANEDLRLNYNLFSAACEESLRNGSGCGWRSGDFTIGDGEASAA